MALSLTKAIKLAKRNRKKMRLGSVDDVSTKPTSRQVTLERVGRRLCLLALQGLSAKKIAHRLGVTGQTITVWLREPGIQEMLEEMSQDYFTRLERQYLRLDEKAIRRAGTLMERGSEETALETIRLYWQTRGRYNPKGTEVNIANNNAALAAAAAQQSPLQREEAQDILLALRHVRDQKITDQPVPGSE